jgi:release factor glutamine methyltransferase
MTDTPRIDAEILLAHALGIRRAALLARLNESPEVPGFESLVERRLNFEPVAYITGEWEFFSLAFKVHPPILVPRPETEHLVEAVLEFVGAAPARLLEIGAGTGCVILSVLHHAPHCVATATDVNPGALELAADNARRHHLEERITLAGGDLFAALPRDVEPFDVICSNPPYVEEGAWADLSPVIRLHEDPRALLAGKDGLDIVRRLAFEATAYLRPGGLLAFEIGMGQHKSVESILVENNYENVAFRKDLAGIERIALARKPRR